VAFTGIRDIQLNEKVSFFTTEFVFYESLNIGPGGIVNSYFIINVSVHVVPKMFTGNTDKNTPVYNDLPSPGKYIEAQYIRVHPQEFRANMCMRFEFYECVGKLKVLLLFFKLFTTLLTLVKVI